MRGRSWRSRRRFTLLWAALANGIEETSPRNWKRNPASDGDYDHDSKLNHVHKSMPLTGKRNPERKAKVSRTEK